MKVLKYVLHVAIAVGLVLAGIRYLNSGDVLQAIASFDPVYAMFLLLLPAAQLAIKGWRFEIFLRPFGIRQRSAIIRAYAAGQPATLLPGGIAARIGLLRQAAVPLPAATTAVLFSSLFDLAVFLICLPVAALWFPAAREALVTVMLVVVALGLLLVVPQVRSRLGQFAMWVASRLGSEEGASRFAHAMRAVMSRAVVLGALGLSVLAFVSDVLLLQFSLMGVGLTVPLPEVFLAYLLPTMLGRMSALPAGGIGLAEAGIVGYLAAVSGVPPSIAVVAAALFRVSTIFLQALYGAIVYWFFWRGEHEAPAVAAAERA